MHHHLRLSLLLPSYYEFLGLNWFFCGWMFKSVFALVDHDPCCYLVIFALSLEEVERGDPSRWQFFAISFASLPLQIITGF